MVDENLVAPTEAEMETLSAREAYWRGRYEESERTRQIFADIVRTSMFHTSASRLTGGIGPGSRVYYGVDPEMLSLVGGLLGVGLGAVGFITSNVLMGGVSLTFGVVLLIATWFIRQRQGKSESS